jgi:hypothetical protein
MLAATDGTSGQLHNMIHIAHCCSRQVIRLGWIAILVCGALLLLSAAECGDLDVAGELPGIHQKLYVLE